MALNLLSPTIFTTSVLVADTVHTAGGSTDSIPTLTMIGGQPVSAALELQATDAAFLFTRMTTAQSNAPTFLATDGMVFFNTDAGILQIRSGGVWVNIASGSGDVSGPVVSVANDIAIFADTTGKLLADSGVSITAVPIPSFLTNPSAAPLVNVNDLGNLGILTFVDPGFISITGGTPLSNYVSIGFYIDSATNLTNTVFVDSTASLIPSSLSALVELDSTTGALLLSRMTTVQKNALINPQNGMILYDTTLGSVNIYQGGTWTPVTGASGIQWSVVAVPTTFVSGNGYIPLASVVFTLPATAAVGAQFRIAGNVGLWTIAQNAGQSIQFGNVNTTTGAGGSLAATNHGDCVELVCIATNTNFAVISSIGNINVS
jgi:hypothetical protein